MRHMRKFWAAALLLVCFTLVPSLTAGAGFQRTADGSYRYYTSQANYIKGAFKNIRSQGKVYTYYFDKKGKMAVGWKKIRVDGKAKWYYFDRNGRMFKNRTKNGHYLQANGQMLTKGWHDGIYYGKDGSAIPGYQKKAAFVKDKKGVKYRKADGTYAQSEWVCITNKKGKRHWYYFYSTGYMAKDAWVGSRHVNKQGKMDSETM